MPLFKYKAKKTDGTEYDGEHEAPNRFEVYAEVRKEGGVVISLSEAGGFSLFDLDKINVLLGKVKDGEKVIFTRNLAVMLEAGLALTRALSVMERQSKNAKLKDIIQKLTESIDVYKRQSRGIAYS